MKATSSILETAEKFWFASQCLEYTVTLSREEIEPYPLPDTFETTDLGAPMTVLRVFSLELYLKALLKERSGDYPYTHDLSELFEALPESDREAFEHRWREREKVFREEDVFDIEGNSRDVKGVGEVLYNIRDHFENWRYYFDSQHAERLVKRDTVVPEIFEVPQVIRDYVRAEVLEE
ncbi:HEPN domain-containing protein [Salinibacter ruber]|uniref:HEPN domain-containing protein n=1 Tax=Salinibacter ruber TaxID=146919 RepID=UPI0020732F9F|nr:HEPN domain-containing protein [Salinibacter ruber]MCS3757366.1 hypothetical protein [Salinibacter ruber]MCS3956225.1 hypothetical protein [Salinibacter ruber]